MKLAQCHPKFRANKKTQQFELKTVSKSLAAKQRISQSGSSNHAPRLLKLPLLRQKTFIYFTLWR